MKECSFEQQKRTVQHWKLRTVRVRVVVRVRGRVRVRVGS